MKKLIRKGKVKEVYEIEEDQLSFFFTDNVSVFDKIVPNDIPRKGETLCKTSTYWFEKVEEELGITTHFIEMSEKNSMVVKKIDVISDYKRIDESTTNYLIPLEFICRYFVAGSLYDRIENGKVDYNEFGFDERPEYGEHLPEPCFEVTTKLEEYDKILTKEEALEVSGLTEDEFEEIKKLTLKIDGFIENNVEKNGLLHVDGKKEFAMDEDRKIMLVDTFGTADEDKFWDMEEYKEGNFIQKSKEFVKQYYRDIGYYKAIIEAREKNEEEPSIPPLPEDMVEQTSELYIDMMEKLTNGEYT
ncbi:MAG: phosphoribosylaminoimidazolesuccinocarboxamide synthase [Candidatus Saliniplasma sp.]